MLFKIPMSREQVNKGLSKLQPLKYNQFRWWRMYEPKNKPLHPRQRLKDKIINGDYDWSCYKLQAYLCEYQLNDLWEECKPDIAKFNEKSSLISTRRNRLLADYEKDEKDRLDSLIKEFTVYFKCNKEQVIEEMEKCSGSILDLYYIIEDKYKIYNIPTTTKRRGRPPKKLYESIS